MPVIETSDLRTHHQRFDLPLDGEVMSGSCPVKLRLFQTLDLNLADGLRYPFRSLRLSRLHEDFGGRLREHHLGQMTIDDLKLGFALKTKNQRVFRLPIFSDRRVKLG